MTPSLEPSELPRWIVAISLEGEGSPHLYGPYAKEPAQRIVASLRTRGAELSRAKRAGDIARVACYLIAPLTIPVLRSYLESARGIEPARIWELTPSSEWTEEHLMALLADTFVDPDGEANQSPEASLSTVSADDRNVQQREIEALLIGLFGLDAWTQQTEWPWSVWGASDP